MANDGKDVFKNLILAGVGALAMTAEKISDSISELQEAGKISVEQGKEIIDELAKKGEITVEQGKAMFEKLKNTDAEGNVDIDFENIEFDSLNDEQLACLKEQIEKIENERKGTQNN
jgi:polyhydroxyalkanoate synthesis regulator phasin